MGVSEALYEEVAFDESSVTSRDWQSYPILKMADMPEVKVVLLHRPEVGSYGGGSEAANALASPATAAAPGVPEGLAADIRICAKGEVHGAIAYAVVRRGGDRPSSVWRRRGPNHDQKDRLPGRTQGAWRAGPA